MMLTVLEVVSNKLCANAYSWLVLAILSCPSEIRNNCNDASCAGTLSCINHQQQFHEIVAVWKSGLNEEYIVSANRLFEGDSEFTIGKVGDNHVAKGAIQTFTDLFC